MSILIDQLKDYGCDIDEAMSRFLNNEAFYERCFLKFLDDTTFEGLGAVLSTQSVSDSFDMAHNLKGVSANLGITPLYNEVSEMVESLRAGILPENSMESYARIMNIRDDLRKIAGK